LAADCGSSSSAKMGQKCAICFLFGPAPHSTTAKCPPATAASLSWRRHAFRPALGAQGELTCCANVSKGGRPESSGRLALVAQSCTRSKCSGRRESSKMENGEWRKEDGKWNPDCVRRARQCLVGGNCGQMRASGQQTSCSLRPSAQSTETALAIRPNKSVPKRAPPGTLGHWPAALRSLAGQPARSAPFWPLLEHRQLTIGGQSSRMELMEAARVRQLVEQRSEKLLWRIYCKVWPQNRPVLNSGALVLLIRWEKSLISLGEREFAAAP